MNSKTLAITGSTGLNVVEQNVLYYATCSLNMSGLGNIAITASGTPSTGQVVQFICNFNTTNYSEGVDYVSFYGFTLPAELATKTFMVYAFYNAAAWRVVFIPSWQNSAIIDAGLLASDSVTTAKILDQNVTTAKIDDDAVTTVKILDSNVTLAKIADIADDTVLGNVSGGAAEPSALTVTQLRTLLDQDITLTGDITGTATQTFATGVTTVSTSLAAASVDVAELTNSVKTELLTTMVSLETAGLGYTAIKVPWACTVEEWGVSVISDVAGTDDATLTLYDHAGNLMGSSTVTVTSGTGVAGAAPASAGFFNSGSISSNNSFTAGQLITIRAQKTTAGGLLMANLKVKRA